MEKSPVKKPPVAQIETEEASVPTLVAESTASLGLVNGNEAVPTIEPPSAISATTEDSFAAGVWNNDKRVNALFSTDHIRNSWMNVVGVGWVKLASNIDSANVALNVLASAAKVKQSPVNYLLDGGQVTQMYVW